MMGIQVAFNTLLPQTMINILLYALPHFMPWKEYTDGENLNSHFYFIFKFYLFIYLGCVGSSFLRAGFL